MAKVKNIVNASALTPTFDEIKQWFNDNMHPSKIDLDDQEVYKYVYHEGRFPGIFQCTGQGAQRFFKKAKPKSIIDIACLTSIYRPGPLAANVDKLWLEHEERPFDWGHELINDTLKETRGMLVFQEGVMALANKVAGFPLEQTDEVRRAIMKRSISGGEAAKKAAAELEQSFVDGAMKNGVPEHTAREAYKNILYFSGYGFNKSLHLFEKIDVFDKTGAYKLTKQIKDIEPGDYVLTRDEQTKEKLVTKVLAKHDHGTLDLVEVELVTGEKVRCTWDHKFRTKETGDMLPLWQIHQMNLSIVVESMENSHDIFTNSLLSHSHIHSRQAHPRTG